MLSKVEALASIESNDFIIVNNFKYFFRKMITPSPSNATSIPPLNEDQEAQTSIYHILMPVFAIVCIIINISVAFSSGLILKKSKSSKFCMSDQSLSFIKKGRNR